MAVEPRRREKRRRGLQYLVGPPQLGVLPTQPLELLGLRGRRPCPQPVVDVGLSAPAAQGVRDDPQLRTDPLTGLIDRQFGLLLAGLTHQPLGPLTHLLAELPRRRHDRHLPVGSEPPPDPVRFTLAMPRIRVPGPVVGAAALVAGGGAPA